MNIQRIRNLTTGRLHTSMDDICRDIETLCGARGVMTHCLPAARKAMLPWLRRELPDPRLWDDTFDTEHTGDMYLAPMNSDDRREFWSLYGVSLAGGPF